MKTTLFPVQTGSPRSLINITKIGECLINPFHNVMVWSSWRVLLVHVGMWELFVKLRLWLSEEFPLFSLGNEGLWISQPRFGLSEVDPLSLIPQFYAQ